MNNSIDPDKPEFINLNVHKAGLDGLDKERIDKIIQEASKGSNFYMFQQKRQKRINNQIERLKQRAKSISDFQLLQATKKADSIIADLEQQRVLNKIIVHFDMDMFFAAVEIKNDPSLADIPMAVGSMAMISTSNYIARRFGVRSAMAGFIAKKLCPQLKLIRPNFRNYSKESEFVMNIISEYDPNIRSFSLDEVYIDLTNYVFENFSNKNNIPIENLHSMDELSDEIWQFANKIVEEIRAKIFKESKLTVSAGISCNTLLSKVCTDINKPNGQFMIKGNREEILNFVSQIQIRKFCGVGPVRDQILAAFNIIKPIDIYNERALLTILFNDIDYYLRVYLGIGSTNLSCDESTQQKSHSRERTIGEISDINKICELIKDIANRLSKDLKNEQQLCKTITLKLKKINFETFIKCKTIDHFTDDEQILYNVGKELLIQEMQKSPQNKYRLIGLRVSNLCHSDEKVVLPSDQSTLLQFFKRKLSESHDYDSDSESNKNMEINQDDIYLCDDSDYEFASDNEFNNEKNSDKETDEQSFVNNDDDYNHENNQSIIDQKDNEEAKFLKCPICHLNTLFNTNDDLNRHIDICLNRQVCIELTSLTDHQRNVSLNSIETTPLKDCDNKSINKSKKSKLNNCKKNTISPSSNRTLISKTQNVNQKRIDHYYEWRK